LLSTKRRGYPQVIHKITYISTGYPQYHIISTAYPHFMGITYVKKNG
jgi:hypothetical protein